MIGLPRFELSTRRRNAVGGLTIAFRRFFFSLLLSLAAILPASAQDIFTNPQTVDANLATTAHGIWALGDAIGGDHRRFQFTHVATYEGPQVAENALRGAHHEPSHLGMPRVTFTDPEVAAVGLTESEAREAGIKVHTCVKLVRELGKARAIGETEGFVKVVIDRATGKLVGATIMAAHAGDMLATLTMPLHTRNGDLGPLLATTFAHPTLSEAVKVAVRDAVASTPAPEAEMTT